MTDFRALCAELLDWLQLTDNPPQEVVDRTRAALAQPEPQGPTDEELHQTAMDTRLYRFQATAGDPVQYELTEAQIYAFARDILARWGRHTRKGDFNG